MTCNKQSLSERMQAVTDKNVINGYVYFVLSLCQLRRFFGKLGYSLPVHPLEDDPSPGPIKQLRRFALLSLDGCKSPAFCQVTHLRCIVEKQF